MIEAGIFLVVHAVAGLGGGIAIEYLVSAEKAGVVAWKRWTVSAIALLAAFAFASYVGPFAKSKEMPEKINGFSIALLAAGFLGAYFASSQRRSKKEQIH